MTFSVSNNQAESTIIRDRVLALPEIYQPIFGYPEYSHQAARSSDDRLAYVLKAYDALSTYHKRPLRVLDLGCAQGFFSFALAMRGASVLGIDNHPANIALCETLAVENPRLNIDFQLATIEEVIGGVLPNQFDFVLGLSVFHHLVHAYGAGNVAPFIARLLENSGAGIFEFALRSEPPVWAAAQPANVRELFGSTAFVHELAKMPTHLSTQQRPLYFASNQFWHFGDDVEHFTGWSHESHRFVGPTFHDSRRYFFTETKIAKTFVLEGLHKVINAEELLNEVQFLVTFNDPHFVIPQLIRSGNNESEAWIVRERIPGNLLTDYIDNNLAYDERAVIRDVLTQLALLESHGLYHSDVRLWNTLIDPQGRAHLIDFGAISTTPRDCLWPSNVYFAFLIFVWGVTTRTIRGQSPTLPAMASPSNLPEPYRSWSLRLWSEPITAWSFAHLLDTFDHMQEVDDLATPPITAADLWRAEMEQFCEYLGRQQEKLAEEMAKMMTVQHEQALVLKHLFERGTADGRSSEVL